MNLEEYERMNSFEVVNWWWVGKRDLIGKTLGKLVNHQPLILDIGCGTGSNLRSWESHGEVLGLDNSPQALSFCRMKGNTNLLKGDAAVLPFRDNTFEVIIALDMLEHMEKDEDTVREFFRVCRPGGHLLLTVPALMFLWSQHDMALHHKRRYSRNQLESLVSRGGFRIERMSFWNLALLLPAAVYRTLGNLNPPRVARSDDLRLPGPLNTMLKLVLSIENRLILKGMNLPLGITLFAVCRKG
ncbi:MAG: class I SAM-dependent methyltransferase [Chloroflexi bacterium]|nr:class I SAM-dependent methyltransferase [Chloroflexota bacterium]